MDNGRLPHSTLAELQNESISKLIGSQGSQSHLLVVVDDKSTLVEMEEDADFTLAEVLQMDKRFKETGEELISQELCEELAAKFNCSAARSDRSSIKWEQVQSWFQERQKQIAAEVTPLPPKKTVASSKAIILKRGAKVPTISAEDASIELLNLTFEARSAKDYAWFDVACFLNYRVLSSGELEVRVRFAGFNNEEDEWVSVRRAVRERSIPLEHSECDKVNVGDLVLCYREAEYHQLYRDAYVVGIERSLHDIHRCTCIFVVCYDYDNFEEKVPVGKLCCRPTQTESRGSVELNRLNICQSLTLEYSTYQLSHSDDLM